MRYILTHATDARWEAGEIPSRELVLRVGALIGDLVRAGAFVEGEGLRASALGVRLRIEEGRKTLTPGPFSPGNELTDGFIVIRTASLEEAVGWAERLGAGKQDVEIDIRPVTEPWDIGMGERPRDLTTTRFMLLRKADAETESGRRRPELGAALRRTLDDMEAAGVLVTSRMLAPSAKGRRYKFSDGARSVIDGPFTESKEMIAGYLLFDAPSLEDAARWAPRYQDCVESPVVDLREVE
jgi:hypothetical protein